MLELAFQPDHDRRESLYRQLADYLRGLVAAGRIAAGEKLPATGELAAALALSRNTVTQAYQSLRARSTPTPSTRRPAPRGSPARAAIWPSSRPRP